FIFSQKLINSESLFSEKIAFSDKVQKIFSFIEKNREKIIKEWILLTEIPAPSGYERERAKYMEKKFNEIGLENVYIDKFGNVIGIWKGNPKGKNIIFSAHMDTVFQGVWKIKVKRDGNVLKAPGIGDDTASCINLLWTLRALKYINFKPFHNYYFLATVGEEIGFKGMRQFLDNSNEKFDYIIALDGDLGKLHYGALGFGGGKIVFRGSGAHTMQSRGIPNPNLAVAKAIDRIYRIEVPSNPPEKWTIYNVGRINGGKVNNAVPQESFFTIDLRSANQEELEKVQRKIEEICLEVARETGCKVEINLNRKEKAHQLPGARNSLLVKTAEDILNFLEIKDIKINPLGSTEANTGIERGIPSINLGRTYCRYKHSLREEADIDGLFLAIKQIILMILSLEQEKY
ncbi:M20/M25/M40 family metallo-hydrolase, partial [Candidatus Aminicenantes bacterium AC-334-E05]|nr:M20/M25/M40 family metallo-hydrolase [Candidatus Aminicenantes bacterium AC-334-E05]